MKKIFIKLSSSESDSEVAPEEDEEGKMYQLIFDMKMEDDKENKEEVQTPSSSGCSHVQVTTNAGRALVVAGGRVSGTKKRRRQRDVNLQDGGREKPWRKVGARLSDFFNFGFTEASWVEYCRKQRELRAHKKRLNPAGPEPRARRAGAPAEAAAAEGSIHEEELQRRRSAHRENSSSSSSSCPADFRWPIDPPAAMEAKERILNYPQVDLSPETDVSPPSSGRLFAFVPPAVFRSQETVSSSSHLVDGGRSGGLEEPSTPLDRRPRGASSSEGGASDAAATRQEHGERRPTRETTRERQNARKRDGRRSSSLRVNRGFTREGERGQRHGERRPRDDEDDMQTSSCSSRMTRSSRRRRSRLRRLLTDAAEDEQEDQRGHDQDQRHRTDQETDEDETYEEMDHTTSIEQEE